MTSVVAVVRRGDTRWVYLDAGRLHRTGRDPGRGDPLPAARPAPTADRPGRACSPGRPATAPTCSTSSSPGAAAARARRGRPRPAARRPAPTPPATRRSASTASRRCRPGSSGDDAVARTGPAATYAGCWPATRWRRSACRCPGRCCCSWCGSGPAADRRGPAARARRRGPDAALRRAVLGGRTARRPLRARPHRPAHPGSPGWCSWASSRRRCAPGPARLAVLAASAAVAAGTPAYPALAAAMPRAAGPARRRATDLLVTVEVAAFVVGPALGGLLLAPWTRPGCRWSPSSARWPPCCWCTACGCRARSGPPGRRGPGRSCGRRRGPGVPRAIATVALLNAVLAATGMALLPLAAEDWSGGYGPATAVLGFGAVAAPLLWRLGGSPGARARAGLVLLAAALAALPLSPALGWALPSLAVAGAAAVHVEGAVTETLQDAVPDEHRAGDPRADRQRDGRRRPAGLAAGALAGHRARGPGAPGTAGAAAAGCAAGAVRRDPETPRPPGRGSRSSGTARRGGRRGTLSRRRRSPAPARGRSRRPPRPRARWWSAAAPRG